MRAVAARLLVAGALLLVVAPVASAESVAPRSAVAFHDSVGVDTHVVYFDTAYADWPRVVAKLDELGVRHVRDGVYANPAWRDWNERYYRAVELAVSHGIGFDFQLNPPGRNTGSLEQILDVLSGRLRAAVDSIEAPNEVDKYVGGPRWPAMLTSFNRELYRSVKARASLRTVPVVGPSFATPAGPERAGNLARWMDIGNIHPYTGGLSPGPLHLRSELARASVTAGRKKPVWATEAGFHNAMRATHDQAPVSERAGAIYLLRTFLEHFRAGIDRTYAYELIDEKPEPGLKDPEQHFGLLRNDFTPKPAFRALKNLLAVVGRDGGRPDLRPLRIATSGGAGDLRRLVLQRPDGTYVVALWRLASVWDIERGRPLSVSPRTVTVGLPGARRVNQVSPLKSSAARRLALGRRHRVRVKLGASPVLLEIKTRRSR